MIAVLNRLDGTRRIENVEAPFGTAELREGAKRKGAPAYEIRYHLRKIEADGNHIFRETFVFPGRVAR